MKSMPLLEDWNKCSSIGVAAGIAMGFASGVFAISVPFSHAVNFLNYRIALVFGMLFFCIGLLATDFFLGRLKNEHTEELKDEFFLKLVSTRVYTSFVSAFLLMYAVTFFTWFLLRTQFQWTNTVLSIAQAIVYFLFCLFVYLSVRDQNFECIQTFHKLPELAMEGEDNKEIS